MFVAKLQIPSTSWFFFFPGVNCWVRLCVISSENLCFRLAFAVYDIDGDGFISNDELYKVLKMMVGKNLKDKQLAEIVNRTMQYADKDEDGRISFDEFCSIVGRMGVHKKMIVQV